MLALAASALCSSVWDIASARFHSPCDAYFSRTTTRLHNSLSFLLRLICSSRTRPFVWVQYTRTLFVFAFAKMSKVKSVCTCESIYAPALCGICVSAKCGVQNLTDRKSQVARNQPRYPCERALLCRLFLRLNYACDRIHCGTQRLAYYA